jgi:hypothetical protein
MRMAAVTLRPDRWAAGAQFMRNDPASWNDLAAAFPFGGKTQALWRLAETSLLGSVGPRAAPSG